MAHRRPALLLLALLALLAGCHQPDPVWDLDVDVVDERRANGAVELDLRVGIWGQFTDETAVEEVRVCAVDDGQVLNSTTIDRLSGGGWGANVTLTTSRPPSKVVLDPGHVESDADYNIEGVERTGDRRYRSFYQDGPGCGS